MPPTRKFNLSKRKGGGGRRKHYGFGSGSSSGISGSGPSISSPSISSRKPSTISSPNLSGGRTSATAYGSGGGSPFTIPSGQLFSGRSVGGGTRVQVYGTSAYGSGYPGIASSSRGVAGRGFPFFFWPVVWGGVGGSSHSYLHDTHEYGLPTNTSRPGNALAQASFISSTTNTTFHIIADNSTVTSLLSSIGSSCASSDLGQLSIAPTPYTGVSTDPQPEQAIQYYRASSVVLTLDGYNNTALADDTTSPPTPLPSGIDMTLLGCLNSTIGAAVPLVDASTTSSSLASDALWTARWPPAGTIALVWLIIGVLQRL